MQTTLPLRTTPMTLVLVLGLITTGCNSWYDSSDHANAVWSENAEGVAYVERFFQAKNHVTHIAQKDFNVQVFISAPNGSNATQLTGILEGNVRALYYMEAKGYVLLARASEPVEVGQGTNPSATQTLTWERIDVNGASELIGQTNGLTTLSCDGGQSATGGLAPLRVIPSPDGSVLARVDTVSDCLGKDITLAFLDSDTLQPLGSSIAVDTEALMAGIPNLGLFPAGFMPMLWQPDGTFLIANGAFMTGTTNGWEFAIDGTANWRSGITGECTYPETTSGNVNANGFHIEINNDGALSQSAGSPDNAFGCD